MGGNIENKKAVAFVLSTEAGDGHLSEGARDMFVRVLISDLRTRGAASMAELIGRLSYMEIRLPSDDVIHVVEHARRHGLVEPLGHPKRADGSEVPETEWRPTNAGLKQKPALSQADASNREERLMRWFVNPPCVPASPSASPQRSGRSSPRSSLIQSRSKSPLWHSGSSVSSSRSSSSSTPCERGSSTG